VIVTARLALLAFRLRRKDAALTLVVGPQDERDVLDADDDDQGPDDQRQHAEDVSFSHLQFVSVTTERLAERVQRARPDVPVHDAEGRQRQRNVGAVLARWLWHVTNARGSSAS
jgi:hypothetical protein